MDTADSRWCHLVGKQAFVRMTCLRRHEERQVWFSELSDTLWCRQSGFSCSSVIDWRISQQTGAQNRIIQFARWKANVIEGWYELTQVKTGESEGYIKNTLYPGTSVANIPVEHICTEIVTRYNGGHYYTVQGGQVVIDTSNGNTTYISNVQPFYNEIIP